MISGTYMGLSKASFNPKPMKMMPEIFCRISPMRWLFLKVSVMRAAVPVKIMNQILLVTRKVLPRSRKGNGPVTAWGLINWGKKERKKRATFGFSTLVITPWR